MASFGMASFGFLGILFSTPRSEQRELPLTSAGSTSPCLPKGVGPGNPKDNPRFLGDPPVGALPRLSSVVWIGAFRVEVHAGWLLWPLAWKKPAKSDHRYCIAIPSNCELDGRTRARPIKSRDSQCFEGLGFSTASLQMTLQSRTGI